MNVKYIAGAANTLAAIITARVIGIDLDYQDVCLTVLAGFYMANTLFDD